MSRRLRQFLNGLSRFQEAPCGTACLLAVPFDDTPLLASKQCHTPPATRSPRITKGHLASFLATVALIAAADKLLAQQKAALPSEQAQRASQESREELGPEIPTTPSKPATSGRTSPREKHLAGSIAVMTFEPDTFTAQGDKLRVADLSGCGNDGIIGGATQTPGGRAGAALQFGGRAFLEFPTLREQLTKDLKELSLACWVMQADREGNAMIFDVGSWAGRSITLYRNNARFRFMLPGGSPRSCVSEVAEAMTWYHLVGVWNGKELVLYVNGRSAATVPTEGLVLDAASLSTEPARLGAWAKVDNRSELYFRGLIDELAIFNRALSAAEVQTLCQRGLRGEPLTGVADAAGQASAPSPAAANGESGKQERTIAILDFADQGPSAELAPLRIALAEMLTGDLSQLAGLRAVERVRVSQFLGETNLSESALIEKATSQESGQTLAATHMVSGRFSATPEKIAVQAALYGVGTKEPFAEWTVEAAPDRFFDLEQQLASNIVRALGIEKPARRPPPPALDGTSPTVAILGLKNLGPSARLQPMESGFAEFLQASLSALPNVRLVEREKLRAVLAEQQLSVSGLADPATAVRVGHLLGAERFVYGSFMESGNNLRIDLRLTDTQSASVLRAESASGPTERFAELVEDLAVRLAADLAIRPPTNAEMLVRAATPARNIEAAMHFANAQQSFSRSAFADAAAHFERALLVEPKNVRAGIGRVKSWSFQKDYGKAIEAGEQTLSLAFLPEQSALEEEAHFLLIDAYWRATKLPEAIRGCDRMLQRFPATRYRTYLQMTRAMGLMHVGRRDEGVAALEAAVKDERARAAGETYSTALQALYFYYTMEAHYIVGSREFQQQKNDPEYMRGIVQRTKESAARETELYELILQDLEGKRDSSSRQWLLNWAVDGIRVSFVNERGAWELLPSKEQRERLLLRVIDKCSWEPRIVYQAHARLAELSEYMGNWQQAIKSYQYRVEHPELHSAAEALPFAEDRQHYAPGTATGDQIESRFKLASIARDHLNQSDVATGEFQRLILDFGVTHHRGVNTVAALDKLAATFEFPKKAALVWGGGRDALVAWRNVLAPLDYTVHRVEQYRMSAAHLAPYQIVILVRTGVLPYEPTDVLALRSYVASGGSLLVVVSPGWEPAAPGIHNPLLAFFHAQAGQEMTVRATSTRIVPHPITTGVEQVMAKNAVPLTVPSEATLVQAGDQTVLAALPYRHGRVVLASFGQWFQPGPGGPEWRFVRTGRHWTAERPPEELPVETGLGLHLPLLRNVISWLDEPHAGGELDRRRQAVLDAHRAGLLDQFRVKPRAELATAMDDLIASAPAGTWKEEALWVAGESHLQAFYFPTGRGHPTYAWPVDAPRHTESRYFQQLVEQFPDSPLRPFAQWRLADCQRRQMLDARRSSADGAASDQQAVIEGFLQVDAPPGSFAWAWSRLRVGSLLFRSGDFGSASVHYREVAERMPNGAEKSLAVLNLSVCHEALGNLEEARRYEQLVLSMPDIFWWTSNWYENWAPMRKSGSDLIETSHDFIKRMTR